MSLEYARRVYDEDVVRYHIIQEKAGRMATAMAVVLTLGGLVVRAAADAMMPPTDFPAAVLLMVVVAVVVLAVILWVRFLELMDSSRWDLAVEPLDVNTLSYLRNGASWQVQIELADRYAEASQYQRFVNEQMAMALAEVRRISSAIVFLTAVGVCFTLWVLA